MTELKDLRKKPLDNPVQTLLGIVLSVAVLLLFMFLCRSVGEGVRNTLANFLGLTMSVIVLANVTNFRKVLGDNVVIKVVVFAVVIAAASLIFSRYYVFNRYIEGLYSHLSHTEHDLMYEELQIISTRLSNGYSIADATKGLPLNQYYTVFVYSSFMFLAGGINLTNIVVWSTLHLMICAVCVALMCYQYGITDRIRLNLIFTLAVCQPLFWAVHHYNKVIIGEAFLLVGMYIYMASFSRPWLNMLLFPVYGWLMWCLRVQYLLIAAVLCLMCILFSTRKAGLNVVLEVAMLLVMASFLFVTMDVGTFIEEELNIGYYTEGSNYSLSALPMRFIRSFLPYFPFTNILTDDHWAFNIYTIPQIVMNLTLWYLVFINALKKRRIKQIMTNPMIVAAVGFFMANMLSDLHATYVSVGTFLLTSELEDISANKVFETFGTIFLITVACSLIYFALGLTGSGSSGIVI